MQLRYVFSETTTGLRRNVSMSVALIVTIFVSLTLVGMGLLLNSQANKAQESWGSKLQITVFLCNQDSPGVHCTSGEATPSQEAAIQHVIKTHPEVASYYTQSKAQAYQIWKKIFVSRSKAEQEIYSTVTPATMQKSYWVKLKNPNQYRGIESAVAGMDGVDHIRDLREVLKPIYQWMNWFKFGAIGIAVFLLIAAILQVGNTIRLAAFARRKEIGIMRLVGASSLYISLPFLMETLVAALIGIALSGAALAAFTEFGIYGQLRKHSQIMEWVNWGDAGAAFVWVAIIGVLLTLIPTLVMTRKYLKV